MEGSPDVLVVELLHRIARKPWVTHPLYAVVFRQELCDREPVGAMPLHPQRERLQAL